jgi:hypothetical protein
MLQKPLALKRLHPREYESDGSAEFPRYHAVMSCDFGRGGSFLSLGDQEEIVAVEEVAFPRLVQTSKVDGKPLKRVRGRFELRDYACNRLKISCKRLDDIFHCNAS